MEINGVPIDNSSIFRRVIQLTCDLAGRPLSGLRVLDLACAHGVYANELAARGASVVAIEAREEWLRRARARRLVAADVEFVQDDVRQLCRERYGEFDVVLCLGILYHLDTPDLFELAAQIADVCRGFAIFETHVAAAPLASREWQGKTYWGQPAFEHAAGATADEKLKVLSASLDNESSFWMTRASLFNLLRRVGFTSVSECQNPMAYLRVGAERRFRMWGNRVTLAAIKGQPARLVMMPDATPDAEADWPEDPLEPYLFEREVQTLGQPTDDAR